MEDQFDFEEWDEHKWEEYFQEEDRKHQRFQELLDKYGHDEEGFLKAMEEMGWGIPEIEEPEEEEPQDIDEILEAEFGSWEPDKEQRHPHPLFKRMYQLTLDTTDILHGIEVQSREDSPVIFLNGIYESLSKLIRAGYDNLEAKIETPRGLALACLKRVRRSLLSSLLVLPKLQTSTRLAPHLFDYLRDEITALLQEVNDEIREVKGR